MFDDFGASIRELRSTLMQSPDSEIQYARKQNSHLLERNAKLQLELTDLKVQFADIVQMVNQTNILHFKEPFESVKSLAEILQQTLNELSDTKATLLNRAKDYSVVVPQSNSPSSALLANVRKLTMMRSQNLRDGHDDGSPSSSPIYIPKPKWDQGDGSTNQTQLVSSSPEMLPLGLRKNHDLQKRIASRVIIRMMKRKLQLAFFQWRLHSSNSARAGSPGTGTSANELLQLNELLRSKQETAKRITKRAIKRILSRKTSGAFRTWVLVTNVLRAQEEMDKVKQQSIARMQRSTMKRTFLKVIRQSMYKAWRTWKSYLHIRRILDVAFSDQSKGRKVSTFFSKWKSYYLDQRQKKRVAVKVLSRLQNRRLSLGFQAWNQFTRDMDFKIQIQKVRRNSQISLQQLKQNSTEQIKAAKEENETSNRTFNEQIEKIKAEHGKEVARLKAAVAALEESESKLKVAVDNRNAVLNEMEVAVRKAQKHVRLTGSIKSALKEQKQSIALTKEELEKISQENEALKETNRDYKNVITTLHQKKSDLQRQLAIRRERASTMLLTADNFKAENEELQQALEASQNMYTAVKEKLLRALRLLELQKKDKEKAHLVTQLRKDCADRTFANAHQAEKIIKLQQRIAKQRATISDLKGERSKALRIAEREAMRAEAATCAAIEAAAANAESRVYVHGIQGRTGSPRSNSKRRKERKPLKDYYSPDPFKEKKTRMRERDTPPAIHTPRRIRRPEPGKSDRRRLPTRHTETPEISGGDSGSGHSDGIKWEDDDMVGK